MPKTKLRVVIFQEGNWHFATQARSLDALRLDLERMLVGHVAIPRQRFGITMKQRGVNIRTPEIRVAPLAA